MPTKNALVTHCPQGHPYDLFNTYYKPDGSGQRDCLTCRRARALKVSQATIATELKEVK